MKGSSARAIADYDEAIRLDPALALAYNNRGVSRRDSGDAARARADFQTAVTMDPALDIAREHLQQSDRQGVRPVKQAPSPVANAAAAVRAINRPDRFTPATALLSLLFYILRYIY